MNKESKITLDPEFGVDSRYNSKRQQEIDSIELLESRIQRMKI